MSDDAYADVDRLARDVRDALCEDVPATGYDRDVVQKFDRLLAAVRHEHGERIVRAIDEQGTWIGPMTKREVIRIIAQTTAARDLSPAPKKEDQ